MFDGCVPYSEVACKVAAENLGLRVDADFTSGSATTKGCYAYSSKNEALAGKVFFGKGGSENDMANPVDKASGQFRPLGHDCKSNLTNYTINLNN